MAGRDKSDAFARLFDGCLVVHPPVADSQLAEIPAKRGVFFLTAESDRPILLTTAASIRARLRGRLDEHAPDQPTRSADLRAITRRVYWKLAGGHFETDWHYLELAGAIWPKTLARLIAWKPPWFVHVDPAETFPRLVRTRDVLGSRGRHFGPFETGRTAERFIEAVQDGFDLCRDIQCLRRSPHGQRCAYGQMARCLCPCDGTISMGAYRAAVQQAAAFAGGDRDERLEQLGAEMKQAAAELRFEHAAAVKSRLDRLAELDGPPFRFVRPVEQFHYLLVQRSGSRRKAHVFFATPGAISAGKPLDYPLKGRQVSGALRRMASAAATPPGPIGLVERMRMGLIARMLFSAPQRRGLILHWQPGMPLEQLISEIDSAAGVLGLSRKARRPPPPDPKPTSPDAASEA